MDMVGLLESASTATCTAALLIWISIGTLSRTEEMEVRTQRLMTWLCFGSAALLFSLHLAGGALFGSTNLPRVLAVVCVAVGVSASLNIKGKEIQGEPNPHHIRRARMAEEAEQE